MRINNIIKPRNDKSINDLFEHIKLIPLADTHEHLEKECKYIEEGPDVLQDLFDNYPQTDLKVAGASPTAVQNLVNSRNPDIEARWDGVKDAWELCQYTGYGEAVSLTAKELYDIDEITVSSIEAAREKNLQYRKPGGLLHMLKNIGNIDHVQIDDFIWQCSPNPAGLDFFFYDINWASHSSGTINLEDLYLETQIEVIDLQTLKAAYEKIFDKYAECAIAVKSQYAYNRSLFWQKRMDSEVEIVLKRQLHGETLNEEDCLCLGDWSISFALEMARVYNLPFKIHTGLLYDCGSMNLENVRPGKLSTLLIHYPETRFVLMHTAYPYSQELLGLAKHFPNVYLDLCWAWAIDPYNTSEFLRHVIHTLPSNKLFAFGGDCHWPAQSVAYAKQARFWITHALNEEIKDGFINKGQAISLATQFMITNQKKFFNLEEKRSKIMAIYSSMPQK